MSAPDSDSDSEGPPMGCDRRLSRAARTVLVRDFLPVLRRHRPPGGAVASSSSAATSAPAGGKNGPADPTELWAHLEAHLGDSSSCPLHPSRDVLREHEAGAETVPNPSYRGRYDDPRVRHQGGEMVHRCGICGREFHGRYYLDRHMDRRHAPPSLASTFDSDSSSSSDSSSPICAATDLCPALGAPGECEAVAYATEPHYGRGSGGHGPDGPEVRARWRRAGADPLHPTSRPPCGEDRGGGGGGGGAAGAREACLELVAGCFPGGSALRSDLEERACGRITCRDRLDRLAGEGAGAGVGGGGTTAAPHPLLWGEEEWDRHGNHAPGFWGAALLLLAAAGYGLSLGMWMPGRGRRSSRPGGLARRGGLTRRPPAGRKGGKEL